MQITLELLLQQLFQKTVQLRWDYDATFPFTSPSLELYVSIPKGSKRQQQEPHPQQKQKQQQQQKQQQTKTQKQQQRGIQEQPQQETQKQPQQQQEASGLRVEQRKQGKETKQAEKQQQKSQQQTEHQKGKLRLSSVATPKDDYCRETQEPVRQGVAGAAATEDGEAVPEDEDCWVEILGAGEIHKDIMRAVDAAAASSARQQGRNGSQGVPFPAANAAGNAAAGSAAAAAGLPCSSREGLSQAGEEAAARQQDEPRRRESSKAKPAAAGEAAAPEAALAGETGEAATAAGAGKAGGGARQEGEREMLERRGWAFGLGIERLCMRLFDIGDIRLFWSQDSRFLSQYADGLPRPFVPFSHMPPVYKDISFWLNASEEEEEENDEEVLEEETKRANGTGAPHAGDRSSAGQEGSSSTQRTERRRRSSNSSSSSSVWESARSSSDAAIEKDLQRRQQQQEGRRSPAAQQQEQREAHRCGVRGVGVKVEEQTKKKKSRQVFTEAAFFDICREVGGDLIESVRLLDAFIHPETQQQSRCYRLTYRAADRTLLHAEVNALQDDLYQKVGQIFNVTLR